MERVNNKEGVPFEHYCQQWCELDPQEAAGRCGVPFADGEFTLMLMGVRYFLAWPEFAVRCEAEDGFARQNIPAQIFMMRYLMLGKAADHRGTFLTYRETPWGTVYLQPFTGRCLTRAAFTFGMHIPAFCAAMERMGAKKLSHGDAAYEIVAFENFKLQVIVWAGDDEFPPNSQILFSENFPDVFSAEDMAVICDILISDVKRHM